MRIGRDGALVAAMLLWVVAVDLHAADKPFDAKRDALQDLAAAEKQAAAEHKYVLLDFGANGCVGCVEFEQTLRDPAIAARLQRSFVVVRMNVGGFKPNHTTGKIRKEYPRFNSYPHVLILAADGKLLRDEAVGELMVNPDGRGYDRQAFGKFLDESVPGQ